MNHEKIKGLEGEGLAAIRRIPISPGQSNWVVQKEANVNHLSALPPTVSNFFNAETRRRVQQLVLFYLFNFCVVLVSNSC